jgi:hypothetical protein
MKSGASVPPEAVTMIANGRVSDEVYDQVRKQFSEKDLVDLTLAVITINGWNRLNVAFGTVGGNYRPTKRVTSELKS